MTMAPRQCLTACCRKSRAPQSRRKYLAFFQFLLLALVAPKPQTTTSTAFLSRSSRRRHYTALSAVSSSSSSSLHSLTVKQLRQLVKDSTNNKRGVLSTLKRKQDFVDFLEANLSHDTLKDAFSQRSNDDETQSTATRRTFSPPKKMPPLQTAEPLSRKDAIFEQVYQRYPTLQRETASNHVNNATTTTTDMRQLYHPIFQHNNVSSDMDLVFIGTASCTPGMTRGVSCTAVRLNWKRRATFLNFSHASNFQGGTWLFDVGECTQLQIQRTTAIKPSKITKIFLTHAHGDHSFGLPGLLCLMGQDRDRLQSQPVEIYGPTGLRMWLRVAIRYSVSRIVPPYRVHEIMNVPMAPEWEWNQRTRRYFCKGGGRGSSTARTIVNGEKAGGWGSRGLAEEDPTNWISQANTMQLEPSPLYGEIEGGRNIYPIYDHPLSSDGAPVWEVEDEDDVKVYAAPMSHGIPCLGYVIEEKAQPGRLRDELVEPIVRRNVEALHKAGFAVPMKAMAVIKNLPPGSAFTFPDGTVVSQEDAVEPPRKGRKVVLCGDTADSRSLRVLARDADVIIHEATNAYLSGVDKQTNLQEVQRDAVVHGHSTPQIAGEFARRCGAKRLIMNHFSARYKGDTTVDSLSIMMRIEQQAIKASGLNATEVAAAWDLMVLPIPRK